MEDNGSTSNYVTHDMAEKMNLKGNDIKLKIEGINTIKEIDTKAYWVPIQDKWGKLHLIQCYGLDKIATDAIVPDHESYKNLCRKFSVSVSQVQRPIKIDLLLSSRTNYLMSSKLVKTFNGMQMFDGPLGKTITGFDRSLLFPNNEGHCHIKSYLTRASPTAHGSRVLHENVACSSGSKAQQTDTISTSLLGRERENENFEIDDLSKKLEAANETTKKVKEEIELKENAVTTMKEMFQDKITKLENEKTAVEERILKLEQTTANMIQSISSAPAPKSENYSKKLIPEKLTCINPLYN